MTIADLGGWPALLGRLANSDDLDAAQTYAAMAEMLAGDASPAQVAGFVVALRIKGETVEELSGLLDAMLDAAALVDVPTELSTQLVDIVGTGGDRSHSINVSTLAMLVVAGAGVPVCKHGNRAASSQCGAADLLAELGVVIELSPAGVLHCLRDAGVAFCFAPRFHPALRHVGPTRRELGIPTAFNILGPMANPARVRRQVVGLADARIAERMLGVMAAHGSEHVMIVHGDDGLDELTTTAPSTIWELRDGEVVIKRIDPVDLGLARVDSSELRGGAPPVNAELAHAVLNGERGPRRDIVLLNAAAGLLVGGVVNDWQAGLELAAAVIDDGRAAATLDRLIAASHEASAL